MGMLSKSDPERMLCLGYHVYIILQRVVLRVANSFCVQRVVTVQELGYEIEHRSPLSGVLCNKNFEARSDLNAPENVCSPMGDWITGF